MHELSRMRWARRVAHTGRIIHAGFLFGKSTRRETPHIGGKY
jgi:hypothetical protein